MSNEFLTMSTVTSTNKGSAQLTIPIDVQRQLDDPDQLAWFVDHDTERLYVVPSNEVSMK